MTKHKTILIDTEHFQLREIEIEQDNLQDIYNAIGCELFDVVVMPNGDAVYFDDEGLMHGPPERYFAILGDTPVIAGNGLIMGTGPDGVSTAPSLTIDKVPILWFVRGQEGFIHRVLHSPVEAPKATITFRRM